MLLELTFRNKELNLGAPVAGCRSLIPLRPDQRVRRKCMLAGGRHQLWHAEMARVWSKDRHAVTWRHGLLGGARPTGVERCSSRRTHPRHRRDVARVGSVHWHAVAWIARQALSGARLFVLRCRSARRHGEKQYATGKHVMSREGHKISWSHSKQGDPQALASWTQTHMARLPDGRGSHIWCPRGRCSGRCGSGTCGNADCAGRDDD